MLGYNNLFLLSLTFFNTARQKEINVNLTLNIFQGYHPTPRYGFKFPLICRIPLWFSLYLLGQTFLQIGLQITSLPIDFDLNRNRLKWIFFSSSWSTKKWLQYAHQNKNKMLYIQNHILIRISFLSIFYLIVYLKCSFLSASLKTHKYNFFTIHRGTVLLWDAISSIYLYFLQIYILRIPVHLRRIQTVIRWHIHILYAYISNSTYNYRLILYK